MQEPEGTEAKMAHYLAVLDQTPEYHWLTRSGQQWYGVGDLEREHGLSRKTLRVRWEDGYLPGARDEGGPRGLQIPRSALIIHLGRDVAGWYRSHGGQAAAQ